MWFNIFNLAVTFNLLISLISKYFRAIRWSFCPWMVYWLVQEKIDNSFEYCFEDSALIIKIRETNARYHFDVKNNKIYRNHKLAILKYSRHSILRLFDEAMLKQYVDQLANESPRENWFYYGWSNKYMARKIWWLGFFFAPAWR